VVSNNIFISADLWVVKNPGEMKAFAKHLRQIRVEHNLSQQELADEADIAKVTLQRIELSKRGLTLDMFISLAKALDVSPNELLQYMK